MTNTFRVGFFFFFRASGLGVVSGEVGRVEHGVRFLIWSTAEWVVVPFPEIQAIRTEGRILFLTLKIVTSCMLFLVLSKCLMLTILLNSHLGSRRWSCIDSHSIDEETKAWRGEQSASRAWGQKILRVRIQSRREAQIQVLNHCHCPTLSSQWEDKFIVGWGDHQDIEKPRGLEFRKKLRP